jgi:predicted pyridoxine 5'-phosphate oxidase superfamily flavin-nucleotide-binding protein
MEFYQQGMRDLQHQYEGLAVADRLEKHRLRKAFNDDDRALIHAAPFFFLATAAGDSVDCSFKGGAPGFVRVIGDTELIWPDYDGNRMYRSLGNIHSSSRIGMLFIRVDGETFDGSAARLRVNGRATIDDSAAAIADIPGAKRIIRVQAEHIFPNCPRYIPAMDVGEPSIYAPKEGTQSPEPPWKQRDFVKDVFDAEKS